MINRAVINLLFGVLAYIGAIVVAVLLWAAACEVFRFLRRRKS